MQEQIYIDLILSDIQIELQEKIYERSSFKHSSISFELKTLDGREVEHRFLSIIDEFIPEVFEIDEIHTLEDYLDYKYVIKEENKFYFASNELLPIRGITNKIRFKLEKDQDDFHNLKRFINDIKHPKGFKDFYNNAGHTISNSINSDFFGPSIFVKLIQKFLFTKHKDLEIEIDNFCINFVDLKLLCNKLMNIKGLLQNKNKIANTNLNLVYIPIGTYKLLYNKYLKNYNSKVEVEVDYQKLFKSDKHIKFLQIVTHGNNSGLDHDNDNSFRTKNLRISEFLNSLNFEYIEHLGLCYCQSFKHENDLLKELNNVNSNIQNIAYTKKVYYESLALLYCHGVIKAQDYTNSVNEIYTMGKTATFTYSTALRTGVAFYANNNV